MKNLKVLLVYPNLQMVNLLPSNISILSAYLKKAGINVRLFDTTFYRTAEKSVDEIRVEHLQLRPFNLKEKDVGYKELDVFEDFRKVVEEYKPDVIGVTATDDTYELGIDLVARVKDKNVHVIVGGVYPTFSPEEVISNENVDSICIGEGEEAFLELCRRIQADEGITKIKNLWVKKDGKLFRNGMRELIDLDSLPFEDFSVFEEKRFFRPMQGKVYRMIPVTIDRGCPFNCSFCTAPTQREIYKDNGGEQYSRSKSVARVIDELKYQVEKYNGDYVYFNSETFFARGEETIEEFAREYVSKIDLPFWCQTHVGTITERRIEILEDMNCDRISIGLEQGNEEFRKKVLKKYFTNKQVVDSFRILEKSSIPVTVNNIIGFPDETREMAFDTIKLNRQVKADNYTVSYFEPYKGTLLRQYCIEKGYIERDEKVVNVFKDTILKMPQFPSDQIRGLVRTFPLYVKMPESSFDSIKVAEQMDEEGDKMFAALSKIYYREYFN